MHRAFNVFSKLTLLLAILSLSFTGCGYRRPAQAKTTGTVTLDGEPVANAALMFIPDSGRPASSHACRAAEHVSHAACDFGIYCVLSFCGWSAAPEV